MAEFNPQLKKQTQQSLGERLRPNCLKCEYFYVTWDPKHPNGCKLFGFKGKELPSVMVKRATGEECPAFTPK